MCVLVCWQINKLLIWVTVWVCVIVTVIVCGLLGDGNWCGRNTKQR